MLSVLGKKWTEIKIDERLVDKYAQKYNFSKTISKILVQNKFDEEDIFYLNNKPISDQSYKKIKDFEKAHKLIEEQIKNNNKLLIFGDYDVDGSCSVAMLARYLKFRKAEFDYFVPDRFRDGYGPNVELLKGLLKHNYNLIIFVDCGTNAVDEINYLNKLNVNSIIIDHHKINNLSLKPSVFINPLKSSEYSKYKIFCSTNLVFFLLRYILFKNQEINKFHISNLLIFAALGTICDVMPLKGINRQICIEAIKRFNLNVNNVFSFILETKEINRKLNVDDFGYLLGPILNSGARLGKSNLSAKLLISEDKNEIKELSNKLLITNEKRKIIEESTLKIIEKNLEIGNKKYILHFQDNLNEGILGIIAARLVEKYNLPTILITNSANIYKGSARSISSVDIGKILLNAYQKEILIKGGGHSMAGGFSLYKKDIKNLDNYLSRKINNNSTLKTSNYISKNSLTLLNDVFFKNLRQLSPFGNQNPNPIFLFNNVRIIKIKILNKKHAFFIASSKGKSCEGILFNSVDTDLGNILCNYKKELSLIAEVKENNSKNNKNLQLILKDIIVYKENN